MPVPEDEESRAARRRRRNEEIAVSGRKGTDLTGGSDLGT